MTTKVSEYWGNILSVRAVEDTVRATKKYTEGIATLRVQHPIQGEDCPTRMFCKYYEVYPDTKISWDMPAGKAIDLLWGQEGGGKLVPMIDLMFRYDYRRNKATVIIKDGADAVEKLTKAIPMFGVRLSEVENGHQFEPVAANLPLLPDNGTAKA